MKPFLSKKAQEFHFKALVLQGIWVIVRAVLYQDKHAASAFRASAITYLSHHPDSNQSDGADKYREENTFQPISWS